MILFYFTCVLGQVIWFGAYYSSTYAFDITLIGILIIGLGICFHPCFFLVLIFSFVELELDVCLLPSMLLVLISLLGNTLLHFVHLYHYLDMLLVLLISSFRLFLINSLGLFSFLSAHCIYFYFYRYTNIFNWNWNYCIRNIFYIYYWIICIFKN